MSSIRCSSRTDTRGARRTLSPIPECTAQLASGRFCSASSMQDVPFPICQRHAKQLCAHFSGSLNSLYTDAEKVELLKGRPTDAERTRDRRESYRAQSVVYYVRIGDYIKIGYSTNLTARLSALRVSRDDVMATEPGGPKLERVRHRQFAHLRNGRRENFAPAQDLLDHIASVLAAHGQPRITSYIVTDAPDSLVARVERARH